MQWPRILVGSCLLASGLSALDYDEKADSIHTL